MTEIQKKLGLWTVVLLIFVPTFGFRNITNNTVALGATSIPSWLIVAVLFFLPLSIMFAELSSRTSDKGGGIYSWISSGLGERWAFIGTWSYFVAGLFYLMTVFSKLPIAISWMLFAENRFKDDMVNWLPGLGILFAISLTWVATRGVQKFSKLSDWAGIFTIAVTVIFIAFAFLGNWTGTPSSTVITAETMTPSFDLGYFSTFSWLLFAVAGAEVAGTYAKETENSKRNFPLAVLIATLLVGAAYVIGSIAVSLVASPEQIKESGLASSGFFVYQLLADQWGLNGEIVVRLYSAIFFVTAIAAYIVWMESPIRAIFAEVPKNTFPKFFTKTDDKGVLKNALWAQCGVLVALIAAPVIGNMLFAPTAEGESGAVEKFMYLLMDLSSLSALIPYLVLVVAYMVFKSKGPQAGDFVIVKSKTLAMAMALVCLLLGTAGLIGAGLSLIGDAKTFGEAIPGLLKIYGGPILLIFVGMGLVAVNRSLEAK